MSKLLVLDTETKLSKLNHLPFNRQFSVRKDLIEKMNIYGFVMPVTLIKTDVIDGKEKLWIADGQHRVATAQYLGIPPVAMVADISFESLEQVVLFVASLNTTAKAWRLMNYVQAYNFLGYADYAFLLKKANKTPYSVNTLAGVYGGFRKSTYIVDKVKNGKFRVEAEQNGDYSISLASKLSKYEKVTSRMLYALHYVANQKGFDVEKFENQYKANVAIIKELKLDDYTDIFTEWGLR